MIGSSPSREDIRPGYRFLTAGWGLPLFRRWGASSRRAGLLCEIVAVDGDAFTFRDHLGETHEGRIRPMDRPFLGKDVHQTERQMAWGGPLPDGGFDEIAVLADAMMQSDWRNRPMLMLCEAIADDGTATCRLILSETGAGAQSRRSDQPAPGRMVATAFVLDEPVALAIDADRGMQPDFEEDTPPVVPRPGDLLVAMNVVASPDDAPRIVQANLALVRRDMDLDEVGRWLPSDAPRPGEYRIPIPLATRDDLDDAIERAVAASEPDEIVVIVVPTPTDGVRLFHQSHSGISLHDVDSLDDHLYGTDLEAGIWIGTGIQWFDCGEDGAEWEADWRRATAADLDRHGLGFEALAQEWSEYAEADIDAAGIVAMLAAREETGGVQ